MDWADHYTSLGLQIIPLWGILNGVCRCRDAEACNRPGKHPRIKWQGAASKIPGALDNWAVATDPLVVIDFDTVESFNSLAVNLPDTFVVATGKGVHVWYLADPDRPRACKVGWRPHVDVRARGGFVVVPPSRTIIPGKGYESIGTARPVVCPDWLLEELPEFVPYGARFVYRGTVRATETNRHFRPIVDRVLSTLADAGEGGRNMALFKASARLGELYAAGYVADDVRDELIQTALGIGLTMDEIERTIQSGWKVNG